MARVVLSGVSKSYGGGHAAVKQIDLAIEDQEFLVLVGPSGCGKTSTLRMIAGLESITAGTIAVGDREVNLLPPKDRDLAMVFQNYALYPHMTVYKNMAFGLELRYGGGWLARLVRRLFAPKRAAGLETRRREIPAKVQQAAQTLGIESLLNRKPHQLSGGERQRVALGRSMVREPAAFLFDEPLSNLDARLRTDMRVELKRLHRQLGATMIYVTHDQIEALTLGDRVAVMDQGRLLQVGPPMEVYDSPNDVFVAEFLGSPGMNFILGKVVSDSDARFESGSLRLKLPKHLETRLLQEQGGKMLGGKTTNERKAGEDSSGTQGSGADRIEFPMILGVRPEDIRVETRGGKRQVGSRKAENELESAPSFRRDQSNSDLENQPAENSEGLTSERWGGFGEAELLTIDQLGDSSMLYLELDADRVTYRDLLDRGYLKAGQAISESQDSAGSVRVIGLEQDKTGRQAKNGLVASSQLPASKSATRSTPFVARDSRVHERNGLTSRQAVWQGNEKVPSQAAGIVRSVDAQSDDASSVDREEVMVQIWLDLERIHFFDPETGLNKSLN